MNDIGDQELCRISAGSAILFRLRELSLNNVGMTVRGLQCLVEGMLASSDSVNSEFSDLEVGPDGAPPALLLKQFLHVRGNAIEED